MLPIAGCSAISITPAGRPFRGTVTLPGSKSITNRSLLLAALANGTSRLSGALKSEDTVVMAAALRSMGVRITEPDETGFVVTGTGRLAAPAKPLVLGNAGTATRFLLAAASLVNGAVTIDGNAHMRRRPIEPLVRALAALGVDATATAGCPPVTVRGRGELSGGRVAIDGGLSSQYVSALLMIAPCTRDGVDVELVGPTIGARGYVDLTLAVMSAFGARVDPVGTAAWHVAPGGYQPADFAIEPDASSATYVWAAMALTGGTADLGLNPSDFNQPDAEAWKVIQGFPNLPPVIDGSQMQDAVPTLAVLAAFNTAPVRFTGIANLRVKECDRIAALATELSRLQPGLVREEGDDLVVLGSPSLASSAGPTEIRTYADHRIAMSFALAGLRLNGISILDPGCVGKTWPGYWAMLQSLGARLEARP